MGIIEDEDSLRKNLGFTEEEWAAPKPDDWRTWGEERKDYWRNDTGDFVRNMWRTYRADYGAIWLETDPEPQPEPEADDITVEKTVLSLYNNVLKSSGNNQAIIHCDLLEAGKLTVKIYDSKGKEIVVLFDGQKSAGRHEFTWSGVDSGGSNVGSGIYLIYMQTKGYKETKKIAVIK